LSDLATFLLHEADGNLPTPSDPAVCRPMISFIHQR